MIFAIFFIVSIISYTGGVSVERWLNNRRINAPVCPKCGFVKGSSL